MIVCAVSYPVEVLLADHLGTLSYPRTERIGESWVIVPYPSSLTVVESKGAVIYIYVFIISHKELHVACLGVLDKIPLRLEILDYF